MAAPGFFDMSSLIAGKAHIASPISSNLTMRIEWGACLGLDGYNRPSRWFARNNICSEWIKVNLVLEKSMAYLGQRLILLEQLEFEEDILNL